MVIVGSGLTALLAGVVNQQAQVYTNNSAGVGKKHQAILRFPTDAISNVTGIPFKKVNVTKSVYMEGEHSDKVGIDIANEYSRKVTGGYYDRSISSLAPAERFIPPSDFAAQLANILKGRIHIAGLKEVFEDRLRESYWVPVVSTIPIHEMAEHLGIEFNPHIGYRKIFVNKVVLDDCDVWHTTYYPIQELATYRASIEGDTLTIESLLPLDTNEVKHIMFTLGLSQATYVHNLTNFPQDIGKITPIDNVERKSKIWELTRDYNIYSLGRVATWRNILLDDVLKDIYHINRMINQSAYDSRVGK